MGSGCTRLTCGAPGVHAPSAQPPGPAAGHSPGSPPSAPRRTACPRPRRAPGSFRLPAGVSLGCREEAGGGWAGSREVNPMPEQPEVVPSTHPPIQPSLLPSSLPSVHPSVYPPVPPTPPSSHQPPPATIQPPSRPPIPPPTRSAQRVPPLPCLPSTYWGPWARAWGTTGHNVPNSPRVQTCTLPCAFLPTVRSTVPRALARAIQGLVWGAKALLRACPLTYEEEQDV